MGIMSETLSQAAPEIIGAALGSFLAAIVAVVVVRLQTRDARTVSLENARRDAFGEVLKAQSRVQLAVTEGTSIVLEREYQLIDAMQVWALYAQHPSGKKLAQCVFVLMKEVIDEVWKEAEQDEPSFDRLRTPGMKARSLSDAIGKYASRFHNGDDPDLALKQLILLAIEYDERVKLT